MINSKYATQDYTNRLMTEYYSAARSISLDYFIAARIAELEQNDIEKKNQMTKEVIQYIDTYYDIIYKDVTNVTQKILLNPRTIYYKTMIHLNNRFSNFDKEIVNAKLSNYGIVTPQYVKRKCIKSNIIAMILSIVVFIIGLFSWPLLYISLLSAIIFVSCVVTNLLVAECKQIKEPQK